MDPKLDRLEAAKGTFALDWERAGADRRMSIQPLRTYRSGEQVEAVGGGLGGDLIL